MAGAGASLLLRLPRRRRMSLIRRNATRTILSGAEKTHLTDTPSADTLAFNLTTSSEFYIGFRKPFAARYFAMGTVNAVAATVTLKYWNGSEWASVKDLVDQTLGFSKSGFMAWENEDDWEPKNIDPISDEDNQLYWIQLTVSSNLTSGATLQAVLNLFCDDDLLAQYYPELINDERYLPEGASTFLAQYVAAKDLVVTRLKKAKGITDESQILDPNDVALAAVHAAAYIIMRPIADTDQDRQRAKDAEDEMNKELNNVPIRVDADDSGTFSQSEKEPEGTYFRAR